MNNKIKYIAIVKEYDTRKGNICDYHFNIFMDKESARRYCVSIVKNRYKEIYNDDNVTIEKLLKFSLYNKPYFELFIYEEPSDMIKIENKNMDYIINIFNDIIKSDDNDLFYKLLIFGRIVIRLNYIGQEMNYTFYESYTDYSNNQYFTENECINGKYKGLLRFRKYSDVRSIPNIDSNKMQIVAKDLIIYESYSIWKNGKKEVSLNISNSEKDAFDSSIDNFDFYIRNEIVGDNDTDLYDVSEKQIEEFMKNLLDGKFELFIIKSNSDVCVKKEYDYNGLLIGESSWRI